MNINWNGKMYDIGNEPWTARAILLPDGVALGIQWSETTPPTVLSISLYPLNHGAVFLRATEVSTSSPVVAAITTTRGAILYIATMIVERKIPGLYMGEPDVDFDEWTGAAELGIFHAAWKGIGEDPDRVNASIIITPEHHSDGRTTLAVNVSLSGGVWIPEHAVELAKLYGAVAVLAKDIRETWDDRELTLG